MGTFVALKSSTVGGAIPGGNKVSYRTGDRANLAYPHCRAGALLKVELDYRDASKRIGFDVVHAVYGLRQGAFGDVDDPLLHLGRRHSRVVPDQVDLRNINRGEDVFGHAEEPHQTHQHHEGGHYHDRDRAS